MEGRGLRLEVERRSATDLHPDIRRPDHAGDAAQIIDVCNIYQRFQGSAAAAGQALLSTSKLVTDNLLISAYWRLPGAIL
jgi:hypothetical protein